MKKTNPALIPRNHQVEKAIQGALKGDYTHFQFMLKTLQSPFIDQDNELTKSPLEHEVVTNTFCGT